MINKIEVFQKYLLWKKLSTPVLIDGKLKYPHCWNCRYWDLDYHNCRFEKEKWFIYCNVEQETNPIINYSFDKTPEYNIPKCIMAFINGNWINYIHNKAI